MACAAADATDALVIRLSYGMQHDSNVFRLPAEAGQNPPVAPERRADTIQKTGIALRFDREFSRQRLTADVLVENVSYRVNADLDHAAGSARVAWYWQVGSLWNGEASHTRLRLMSSFADIRDNVKNLVDLEQAVLNARFRFHPRWNMTGSIEDVRTGNSQSSRRTFDAHSLATTFGVNYVTPAENTTGLRLKLTHGDFPNRAQVAGSVLPSQYDEREASAVLVLRLSGLSSIDGRIGFTERRHNQFASRDYRGVTGRGRYQWTPTGKLEFEAAAWRELRSWEDPTASYVLATGIGIIPTWSVTSKIRLRANLSREQREFLGDPGLPGGGFPMREDRVDIAQLTALYAPDRNLELGLTIEQGRRRSTLAAQEFDFRSILANLRASF